MKKALIFLTEGFEETEALTTVDLLRRGGVDVTMVSLGEDILVTGSRNITVTADCLFGTIRNPMKYDMLILPGGPGHSHYMKHEELRALLQSYNQYKKHLAAICAAPVILAQLGLLEGKKAVCYPGMEAGLAGAVYTDAPVIADGNITTAKGAGASVHFALELIKILQGVDKRNQVAENFIAMVEAGE